MKPVYLVLIMLLTVYAPVELTRLIIESSWWFQNMALQFTIEIAFIWIGWALIPLVYLLATRKLTRR